MFGFYGGVFATAGYAAMGSLGRIASAAEGGDQNQAVGAVNAALEMFDNHERYRSWRFCREGRRKGGEFI